MPSPGRTEGNGESPVTTGDPIPRGDLTGRIVFDDYDSLFSMRADGTDLRRITGRDGPEFDGSWSPDGRFVAYRDSRRGINEDDEIFVVAADGTGPQEPHRQPGQRLGRRLVARRRVDRLQLRPRRHAVDRLPRPPGRLRPAQDPRRDVVRVPVVLARRDPDRVQRPPGERLRPVRRRHRHRRDHAAHGLPGLGQLARLVARRHDDRLRHGARRLPPRAGRRRTAGGAASRASTTTSGS